MPRIVRCDCPILISHTMAGEEDMDAFFAARDEKKSKKKSKKPKDPFAKKKSKSKSSSSKLTYQYSCSAFC